MATRRQGLRGWWNLRVCWSATAYNTVAVNESKCQSTMYHIVDFDLDESRSVTRRDDQMTITSNQTHPIFKFAFTAERDTLNSVWPMLSVIRSAYCLGLLLAQRYWHPLPRPKIEYPQTLSASADPRPHDLSTIVTRRDGDPTARTTRAVMHADRDTLSMVLSRRVSRFRRDTKSTIMPSDSLAPPESRVALSCALLRFFFCLYCSSSTTEPWIKWECKLRCSPDPLDLVPPFDVPESFFQHPMSYHAHPSHRPAKAAKMYRESAFCTSETAQCSDRLVLIAGEFCRHCDPCPTCGARPQPERPASDPVLNEPVRSTLIFSLQLLLSLMVPPQSAFCRVSPSQAFSLSSSSRPTSKEAGANSSCHTLLSSCSTCCKSTSSHVHPSYAICSAHMNDISPSCTNGFSRFRRATCIKSQFQFSPVTVARPLVLRHYPVAGVIRLQSKLLALYASN